MKLWYSPTSPFVRKVTVAAIELGLAGRIERIITDTRKPDPGRDAANPLGKVPALVLDDGDVLYDSTVICEYLAELGKSPRLFPPAGPGRWRALREQALGNGILEAAVLQVYETRWRPAELLWPDWLERQHAKVTRGLDRLEDEADGLEGPLTIGHITLGCALGYLDFRFAEEDWRAGRPKLAAWYDVFAARAAMRETVPKMP